MFVPAALAIAAALWIAYLVALAVEKRITHSMCAAGFAIRGLGTNETFDISAPEGAFIATNWMLHGAANARIHTDLKDWTFPFGNDFVTNLAAFAFGKVMTDTANPGRFFAPFAASLGIPPEANWERTGPTGVPPVGIGPDGQDARRPSLFWRLMTPSNTLICTWQNVLLDRAPTNPVSFQVEFRPGGSFIYRYDLSRLPSEECLTKKFPRAGMRSVWRCRAFVWELPRPGLLKVAA